MFLFLLLTFFNGVGQIDTLFWFVAPEITEGGRKFDEPIVFRFSSLNNSSIVTIDMPANNSFSPITFSINANSARTIDISPFISLVENKPPNLRLNKGIRIRASNPISVYYEAVSSHCDCNPEIFTLKGQKALGKLFYTPFQDTFRNGGPYAYSPTPYCAFDIVATEDNTVVTITPSKNIVGHSANITFTINLSLGQTYSAAATSILANQHLGGSKIESNKPIAVTLKDDVIGFRVCADLAGDQLIPIDYIGRNYIIMKGFLEIPDRVHVLATENNTQVTINNSTVATLNEGQTYVYRLAEGAVFINANKNVYVMQLSGFGCEIGKAILPSVECTGSKQVAFTRSTADNFYLMLLVESGGEFNFELNNNATIINGNQFLNVPNTNGKWKYVTSQFNTNLIGVGTNTIVTNKTNRFHLGVIHGTPNNGTRFGYFSDFSRFEKTQALADKTVLCEGENLGLIGNTTLVQGAFWTGPNGFYSTQLNPVINQITLAQQGYYVLHAPGSECASGIDSVLITIKTALPKPILSSNGPVCPFERLALYVNNKPTYPHAIEWYDSKGNVIGNGDSLVFNPVRELDGNRFSARYIPIGDSYCLGDTALLLHTIKNFPTKPRLEGSKEFCENDTIKLTNYSEHDQDVLYLWTGPNGLSSSQLRYWILPNAQQPFHNGLYTLQLSYSNGCKSELDTTSVLVVAYPKLNLVETTQNSPICEGDMLLISANSSESDLNYRWKSPDLNFFLTQVVERENSNLTMEGLYSLSVGRKNCIYFDTLHVQTIIYPHAKADFAYTPLPASRSETVFFNNRSTNALTYNWDFTDGFHSSEINPSHIFVEEKRFWVKLIAYSPDSLCPDTVVKSVDVFNKEVGVYVPTAFSPNRDQVNDRFRVEASGVSFEIQMDIYNRWGEMIFTTPDARNVAWDGTFMGKECPPGVYLYIIQYIDKFGNPKASKGTISIIR